MPYGRSLTYRFAQAAFWSAIAYTGVEVEGLSRGQVKGLLLRNLRWWMRQPIFTPDGLLSIGYTSPNLLMVEGYNAPGSPYWASKALLVLALPAEDPFWAIAEEPLPPRSDIAVQRHAGLIFQHDDARAHTIALANGQFARFMATPPPISTASSPIRRPSTSRCSALMQASAEVASTAPWPSATTVSISAPGKPAPRSPCRAGPSPPAGNPGPTSPSRLGLCRTVWATCASTTW